MTKDQHGSVIVTGGAGFIGSTLVRHLFKQTSYQIVIVDKLTYASNLTAIEDYLNRDRVVLEKVDVAEKEPLQRIFAKYQPHSVFHLAAESHVDNSIASPTNFIATNIVGTYQLLEASLHFWRTLPEHKQQQFRFIHVSTDEVFGELELNQPAFDENNRYLPNSPYSASKASADHLVRAWYMTYGLPTITTNCSNNYGEFQYKEKLIPLMIHHAIEGLELPVYGNGKQLRDWIHVQDHVDALFIIQQKGQPGDTYCIGGGCEKQNISIVNTICEELTRYFFDEYGQSKDFKQLITFVDDRLGHDYRYAINSHKMMSEFGWQAQISFSEGMKNTVRWYAERVLQQLKGQPYAK